MSEEQEILARIRSWGRCYPGNIYIQGMVEDAEAAIERLIRERDEARRELEELDFLRYEGGEQSIGREIEKAEARGFERGVQEQNK
jgi:hypothetical protein